MSRRPPWDSFRSGSSRKPTSPLAAWRSATLSASTPSHGGFWRAQRSRAPSRTGSATLASPQTTRASSSPRATRRSSAAMSRTSAGLADAVVEGDALVPHRIPDAVGGGGDVLAALVDEDHVEVAEGAQLAPSVAADGHQGHAPGVAPAGFVEEAGEPLVGRRRVGPAEGVAPAGRCGRSAPGGGHAGTSTDRTTVAPAVTAVPGRYAGANGRRRGIGTVGPRHGRRWSSAWSSWSWLVPARSAALPGQPGVGRDRGGRPGRPRSWWSGWLFFEQGRLNSDRRPRR